MELWYFGDCMKGRIRIRTAITPAYAHAYQTICLAMHSRGVSHHSFRLPKPKSRYPYLPNDRSITRELGNDYYGWAIYTEGGTRVVDGEIFAGWGCDFPIPSWGASLSCLVSVLSFIGSVCAPDKATLKAEHHALQCTTAGPYYTV